MTMPPHPDGPMLLFYTAACETCRPREVHRWLDPASHQMWVRTHQTRGPDHQQVTIGTMRARSIT